MEFGVLSVFRLVLWPSELIFAIWLHKKCSDIPLGRLLYRLLYTVTLGLPAITAILFMLSLSSFVNAPAFLRPALYATSLLGMALQGAILVSGIAFAVNWKKQQFSEKKPSVNDTPIGSLWLIPICLLSSGFFGAVGLISISDATY